MKYFKYIPIHYSLISRLILLSIVFFSCTKDMKNLNEDKKLITDKMLEQDANEGGYTLPGMQLGIVDVLTTWRIEMQQNLNADNYSGYMSLPAAFYDNKNNGTYFMVDSWDNQIWLVPSSKVLDQWLMMKKKGFDTKYPDLYSMALIFKVFAGHRLVDIFGPMPYSLYGTTSDVKFDSEEEAYTLFFEELRSAVTALKAAEAADPAADQIRYARFDKSRYGGNYATWVKVANTLRLRLALRISNVDPVKGKMEAEAAVNDGGLLESAQGSFEMTTGTVHPLLTITRDWGETRLNAAVETILGGYHDPRLSKYALPASDPALNGEIKGLRSGSAFNDKSYMGFSQVNFVDNPFVKVMDVAESYFLRAEGALKGWDMGGTAKDFYEDGIRTSFTANKVSGAEEYINDNTSTPLAYIDPNNSLNNAPPITSLTIKWDESATAEEKLERIITQKWIAMYPDGQEAWSEFRRTGYPKLWPVTVNLSGGDVPVGEFIKRINYPSAITNASQSATAEAVDNYLGGQDKLFTPLWWDVN
ncbi:MAG: SusD/RagB family nutrient-binding outer membrane lipoprotein [Flavitalea sp.]